MKIVFISGRLGGGGSERVLTLLANEMLKSNDISIITFGHFKDYKNNYQNSCPVYPIEYNTDFDQICKIRRIIKSINPDIVIAFEYYIAMKTIIACTGLRTRVIVSERNDPHKLDAQKAKRILRDYLYKKAERLVCQTNDAANYFNDRGINNTVVIMNPIKKDLPVWKGKDAKKIIVNFCKLEKQKNLPLLINAFSRIHKDFADFELHIYGEGTEEDNLRILINELKLQDSAKIYPFSDDIHNIVSECYMFVSSSYYEGLSNSMLEALAIGIPVICTDCPIGGAKMVIENKKNGILIPVDNQEKMEEAIRYLIENEESLLQFGENSVRIREELSIEKITDTWDILIREVFYNG